MALHYHWGWDITLVGSMSVRVVDSGGAFTVTLSSGTYCHTDISSVESGYTDFATALQTAIDAAATDTFTVSFSTSNGYTIANDSNNTTTLDFTTPGAAGTLMRQALGFSGNQTGTDDYSSNVRPHYWIIPAIQGRSNMSDEYEPDGVTMESSDDSGGTVQLSRDTSEVWSDWTQAAEIEDPPAAWEDAGTMPYKRQEDAGTSADDVSWSYQRAWEHHRLGDHPFLCIDGSEQAVHRLRADGSAFHPVRFASGDYGLWSIPFRTRLLGRL